MQNQQVLDSLPANLEWFVFFRLSAIAQVADADVIRSMYFIPEDIDLSRFSHVVLTSAGRCLAPVEDGELVPYGEEPATLLREPGQSIFTRYQEALAGISSPDADCIGVGRKHDDPPAFLGAKFGKDTWHATVLLAREPSRLSYDLLPAIGVEFAGGENIAGGYRAKFNNRLGTHIKSGILAGFSRTMHCNEFFIDQAVVSDRLAQGLRCAFGARLKWGRARIKTFARELSGKVIAQNLAMTCVPPPPEAGFAYGDIVPAGMLARGLAAINAVPSADPPLQTVHGELVLKKLHKHVASLKTGGLWAFHRGRLTTATDSALVLLGVRDIAVCEALEAFSDGNGAYFPQLWSPGDDAGRMLEDPRNRHWRQADFATTCLVRGVRAEMGLPVVTPAALIAAGYGNRSGLFFANPYLVDWCLALAIRNDPQLTVLGEKLLGELIVSANDDGSFGRFDPELSTALAILGMDALGYAGPHMRLAQIRLLNYLDAGPWPISTPFYSTFVRQTASGEEPPNARHFACGGEVHELSLYQDTYRVVFAGVVASALAIDSRVDDADESINSPMQKPDANPRYRCANLEDYIVNHALPPYLGGRDAPLG